MTPHSINRDVRGAHTVAVLCACMVLWTSVSTITAQEGALVRLTTAQYERSVHDIFGESIKVDGGIVDPGVRENGLLALGARKLTLSAAALERYESLARQVAAQVTDPRHRATLIPCKPQTETAPDPELSLIHI